MAENANVCVVCNKFKRSRPIFEEFAEFKIEFANIKSEYVDDSYQNRPNIGRFIKDPVFIICVLF